MCVADLGPTAWLCGDLSFPFSFLPPWKTPMLVACPGISMSHEVGVGVLHLSPFGVLYWKAEEFGKSLPIRRFVKRGGVPYSVPYQTWGLTYHVAGLPSQLGTMERLGTSELTPSHACSRRKFDSFLFESTPTQRDNHAATFDSATPPRLRPVPCSETPMPASRGADGANGAGLLRAMHPNKRGMRLQSATAPHCPLADAGRRS